MFSLNFSLLRRDGCSGVFQGTLHNALIEKWRLQVLDGVTSDGASDAKNASAVIAKKFGAWVLICYSHNISLVIGDCNDVLAELLDKVGKILNVYNKSDVLGLLAEMSKERGTSLSHYGYNTAQCTVALHTPISYVV